jgi:two-component system, NtrC family, sensor histidine kinase HydH
VTPTWIVLVSMTAGDNSPFIPLSSAIEDTGPGIPHAIRDKVFEPFITAAKEHGLGLGLAFSRQAVLDHGGDMWIEPAAGARFVIRFPLLHGRTTPTSDG